MAVNASTLVLRSDARADQPLPGTALQVLCGLAWLGVAWSFSFLDRARGGFAFFAVAWVVIGAVGFGLGVARRGRPEDARRAAKLLTLLAGLLIAFPGFFMFILVRWAAFALLMITAARAAALQTRRDLYYALAAIVAVSLLVLTHANAQWTIWFYLAPAWLCVAMALAWDYAAEVRLPAYVKAGFTSAFLAVCIVLGLGIATLLPLPPTEGFGMLEPGTNNPGRVQLPAGPGGGSDGHASGDGAGQGSGRQGPSRLGGAIARLREALSDRGLPAWQRSVVASLLAGAEALALVSGNGDARIPVRPMTPQEQAEFRARAAAVQAFVEAVATLLWWLLLAAGVALVAWKVRWRLGIASALGGAWLLGRWAPGSAMRCSMLGLRWMLLRHRHPMAAGQSVLEHVESATFLPATAQGWLREAVRTYGGWRFGGLRASPAQAALVRQRVVVAEEVLRERR